MTKYAVCEEYQRAEDGLPCTYLSWARALAREQADVYGTPYVIVKRRWFDRGWKRVEVVEPAAWLMRIKRQWG